MYRSLGEQAGTTTLGIRGIARDNNGNIYKVVF
jgi:hypothetical protein